MADAFECDRCEELHPGLPHQHLSWGPTEESAIERRCNDDGKVWEFCEDCWTELQQWLGGTGLDT